jgi:hypothetical protein
MVNDEWKSVQRVAADFQKNKGYFGFQALAVL